MVGINPYPLKGNKNPLSSEEELKEEHSNSIQDR
jgi:hypothetical protein